MNVPRNPVVAPPGLETVVDSRPERHLHCLDFDEHGNDRGTRVCRDKLAKSGGNNFRCPNVGAEGGNGKCEIGAFLYPRKLRPDGTTHHHQGIDISPYYHNKPKNFRYGSDFESDPDGVKKPRAYIVSVVQGKVVNKPETTGGGGYGLKVVIKADDPLEVDEKSLQLYYIYAHCHSVDVSYGDTVLEGQKIGVVGRTGFVGASGIPDHLHFEVSTKPSHKKGDAEETKLGGEPLHRLDPLRILTLLGPWGNNKAFTPLGVELTTEGRSWAIQSILHEIERIAPDGCYPIGANSLWHGGVHLPMKRRSMVHAPLTGTIVAARLGSDPSLCEHEFGSANFILLRHELPRSVVAGGSNAGGSSDYGGGSTTPKVPNHGKSIGAGKANPPEQVKALKARLHELGYYADAVSPAALDDPEISDGDVAAIEAFQEEAGSPYKNDSKPWPDGVVTIGGYTWGRLFAASAPPAPGQPVPPAPLGPDTIEPTPPPLGPDTIEPTPTPTDPKRTVYTLLMHLAPVTADDAYAQGASWLPTVDIHDPQGEADDAAEASEHQLLGDVGRRKNGTLVGAPVDVQWVCKRLIRFELLDGPPRSTTTSELVAAIEQFQKRYPFEGKGFSDGLVERGSASRPGTTATWLTKTYKELRGGKNKTRVDPELTARLDTPDFTGTTFVVILNHEVDAGTPLWPSGDSVGFDEFEGPVPRDEIHWEMFSEELLFEDEWNRGIEDKNDDLTTDLPPDVIAEIEAAHGDIVTPAVFVDGHISQAELENFYRSEDGARFRRTPVKFRSEWGVDMKAMLAALERKHADPIPPHLRALIAPYQWWFDAQDVVPKSPKVWHYNPLEFLSRYQDALTPGPPPEPPPPEEIANLEVVVLGDNGMPPKKQSRKQRLRLSVYPAPTETTVPLAVIDAETVDRHGIVRASSIPPGPYSVVLERGKETVLQRDVHVRSSSEVPIEQVTLQTPLEGQAFGNLSIYIKQAERFGPAAAAKVSIVGPAFPDGVEKRAWGANAVVVLKGLQPGTYEVKAKHGGSKHPNDAVEGRATIAFAGASQKELIQLGYPRCSLTIVYDHGPATGTLTWPDEVLPELFDFMQDSPLTFDDEGRNEIAIDVPRSKHPYKITIGGQTRPVSASRRERRFVFNP